MNSVVPEAEAVRISSFSVWLKIAAALPVAPRPSGCETSSAEIGETPIPRERLAKRGLHC